MADNYQIMSRLVDELAAHGLRDVCLSPGSRSAPLALAFARHPHIQHWVHHDERSSAFFALGIAKTTGRPCAVVTTSGTAAAELLPAAVEARFGQVPLLLFTADRPPRFRGTGANQTIDQANLYGTHAKWFHDAPTGMSPGQASALGARAWSTALTPPAGPVHVNMPFEEPLVPARHAAATIAPRATAAWSVPSNAPDRTTLDGLGELIGNRRTIIVAGPMNDAGFPPAVADLARATGFPVLADALSGVRSGGHDRGAVVSCFDAIFQAGLPADLEPEAILRFGAVPTSKAFNTWIGDRPDVAMAVVDARGWPDPSGNAELVVAADPADTAGDLAKLLTPAPPSGWLERWLDADGRASAALEASLGDGFGELAAARAVYDRLPDPATLWISSSMPVRHAELLFGTTSRSLRLLANRGASGVDGFLSSGIGSAMVGGSPTYMLSGDLSVFYDLTALAFAGRHSSPVTIVALNNDGGGIFHLLPQEELAEFEELFAAPHGLDFEQTAGLFDIRYSLSTDLGALTEAVAEPPDGPHLIEVRTNRDRMAQEYRAAIASVKRAMDEISWPRADPTSAGT